VPVNKLFKLLNIIEGTLEGRKDEVECVNSHWVTVKKLFTLLNIIEGTL